MKNKFYAKNGIINLGSFASDDTIVDAEGNAFVLITEVKLVNIDTFFENDEFTEESKEEYHFDPSDIEEPFISLMG